MKVITDAEIRTHILPSLSLSVLLHSQAVAFRSLPTSQCPPRLALTTPRYTSLFMPARTDTSVIKIVSVPQPGAGAGIPGTNLVIDDATGRVSHVVDSSCLTALRTAAGSLLSSAVALGRGGGVERAVCFGDGQQAVFHVWLHARWFERMREVVVVVGTHRSVSRAELEQKQIAFTAQLKALSSTPLKITFTDAQTDKDAIRTALGHSTLVFTCTPSTTPLFTHTDLGPHRTHICAVGSYKPSMCELPAPLVRSASHVLVDSVAACAVEAGCLIQAFADGKALEERCTELGSLLPAEVGSGEGFVERLEACVQGWEGCTVFKSVGVGLQDVEITKVVVGLAGDGVGTEVAF